MSKSDNPIQIFQAYNGALEITVDKQNDTVWLSQVQISKLFDKSISTINEHINNIYREGEVDEPSSLKKFGNS